MNVIRFQSVVTLVSILLAGMISVGCARKAYVPIQTITTDSVSSVVADTLSHVVKEKEVVERQTIIRDTIVIRDSIVIKVSEDGNVISKEVYRDREHNSSRQDAIAWHRQQIDSLKALREEILAHSGKESIEKPVEVERPATMWERIAQRTGVTISVLLIFIVIVFILRKRLINLK